MSYLKKAVTRITLDLSMTDVQKSITCTRGDRLRLMEIIVTNEGKPFHLPPNWSAMLTGTKPDGKNLTNGCVVENGRIVYDFEAGYEIATCLGRYAVTVWIYDEEGVAVAMPKLWVNVVESGAQQIVESNDQFNVLLQQEAEILALQLKDKAVDEEISGLKAKDEQVDEELKTLSSKIGNVVSTRVITIDPSQWTDASPYEARIDLFVPMGTAKNSTVLLIPKNTETRYESQRIELAVEAVAGDTSMYFMIDFVRQDTDPPTIPLQYLALVVYDENAPESFKATAEFVGVVNLPDELMEREVKRALEVLGVTEDLITTMGDVNAVQKDISAAKISIEVAKDNIAEAKQDIDQAKTDIDQAKTDIDQAKTDIEKMVSVESVIVSKTAWTAAKTVTVALKGAADPDTVFFLFPANEPTKTAATKARMTTAATVPSSPSYGILSVTLNVEDVSFVKEIDLLFTVLHVREKGATERRAVLVGVDSYGDIVPTSIDLSGLDDGEVVETFADGTTKTTTIEYDADGNPVKITDGDGNETVITW